ncbi:MAG: HEAT repeat domain-containing protein [Candidatus Omnitrophica bacterium]|nr:HEAT repeat domain-containing protein [Candidatus Omnitrophota bacterium]
MNFLKTSLGVVVLTFVFSFSNVQAKEDYSKKSVQELITVLKSEDSLARAQAAGALGKKGPQAKDAVDELIGLLKDSKQHVQVAAMNALVQIGNAAVPGLSKAVDEGNKATQFYAANALKKIGTPKAMEVYKKYAAKGGK